MLHSRGWDSFGAAPGRAWANGMLALACPGPEASSAPELPEGEVADVVMLALNRSVGVALLADGSARAWGHGLCGERLGLGDGVVRHDGGDGNGDDNDEVRLGCQTS